MKTLFQDTQNANSGTIENGWIKTSDGRIYYPTKQETTALNYDWSLMAGKKVTEWFHCHPRGVLYPSWSDFEALCYRYARGMIKVEDFSYGVVSAYGCIAFVISSELFFATFAEKVNNKDAELINLFIEATDGTQHGIPDMLNKIAKFISQTDSGLELLFNPYVYAYEDGQDVEYWGTWEAKEYSRNEAVAKDCK